MLYASVVNPSIQFQARRVMSGKLMKNIIIACSIAFIPVLGLPGCDNPPPSVPSASPEISQTAPADAAANHAQPEKHDIAWFDGSVDQAFELARERNKPLFLYWGAVWCPPCVEIKQTVFKSPQFIAQSRLFIPVYLDGDTERAQVYGEKFDTKVYPTMIVFSPAGEEVTRLNAGIDISSYNTVLELSLDNMRPTHSLVGTALRDPESLNDEELQQLAYYSWYDGKALPEDTSPELFNTLHSVAADRNPEASARFYLQYLAMLSVAREGGDAGNVQKADPGPLMAILRSPDLLVACWDYLIVPENLIAAVDGDAATIEGLRSQWASALRDNRHDDRLTTKNQVYAWRPYLVFYYQDDEAKARPLPEDVIAAIRTDGEAAAESVAGTHARQSVINTVSNVYVLAGMTEDARALLTAEIEKSGTPYYFMGSLAELEEQEGNESEALEWRMNGYQASQGPATRIRWWASYVEALTRLAPEEQQRIVRTSMEIFDPSNGMEEFFSGANFRNLSRANTSLREWDRDQQPQASALGEYRASLQSLCNQQAQDSPEHIRCTSLLGPTSS
jgi:thiol-disulfide isomerase/thioredoxin